MITTNFLPQRYYGEETEADPDLYGMAAGKRRRIAAAFATGGMSSMFAKPRPHRGIRTALARTAAASRFRGDSYFGGEFTQAGEDDFDLYGAMAKAKKKRIAAAIATGGMSKVFSKSKTKKGGKAKATGAMIATGGLAAPFVALAAISKKRKAKKAAAKKAGAAEKPAPIQATLPPATASAFGGRRLRWKSLHCWPEPAQPSGQTAGATRRPFQPWPSGPAPGRPGTATMPEGPAGRRRDGKVAETGKP